MAETGDSVRREHACAPAVVHTMTCKQAAHWYLDQGLRPIPWVVGERGRKVAAISGFTYPTYTVTHGDIDRWADHWQVGLAMGQGYWAVDIDSYAELARWEQEVGPLEVRGWRQTSGRADGGEHRLYRSVPGAEEPRHGKFSPEYPHLEIISNGLLAVAPSVHPSGRRYAWARGTDQPDQPGRALLGWLLTRAGAEQPGSNGFAPARVGAQNDQLDIEALLLHGIQGGGHDNTLTRLAFQLRLQGRSRVEANLIWWMVVKRTETDPARPFTEADFDRHWGSAEAKLQDYLPPVAEEWMYRAIYHMSHPDTEITIDDDGEINAQQIPPSPEEAQLKVREMWRLEARDEYRRRQAAESFATPVEEQEITLATGLALPVPERRYLVEGVIGEHHNITLTAGYKTGKTTMIGNLGRSLVDGVPFLGQFNVSPDAGNVGFWNLEMDPEDLYEYWRPIGVQHSDRIVLAHLRGSRIPFMVSEPAREWAIEWLVRNEITTWIVDSWTRLCNGWHGIAEKDNAGYAALTSAIDEIKAATGVNVFMATCHMPRAEQVEGQERSRGGAALDDWVDARWVLTRQEDERFLFVEGRGVGLEETALVFDEETRRLSIGAGNRADARDRDVHREVMEFVRVHPGATTQEIKDGIPVAAQRVTNALNRLIADGAVLRVQDGRAFRHTMVPLPGS